MVTLADIKRGLSAKSLNVRAVLAEFFAMTLFVYTGARACRSLFCMFLCDCLHLQPLWFPVQRAAPASAAAGCATAVFVSAPRISGFASDQAASSTDPLANSTLSGSQIQQELQILQSNILSTGSWTITTAMAFGCSIMVRLPSAHAHACLLAGA